jgi:ABC-type multidrug transport system fused ATPase/permease subunit
MTEETPTPAPNYANIAHPAWRVFFLLFSGLFWFELATEFSENSIGEIIKSVTFALGFLGMAVFAKPLAKRAVKRQLENPNASLDVLHSPLKHLAISILSMGVLGIVMAFDVVLVDPVKVGLAMLGGGVSLFLWMYVALRLANRGRLIRFLVCTPVLLGFPYSICYIEHLNDLLTNPEAGFVWPIFGVVLAVFIGISTMNPAVQLGGEPVETTEETGEVETGESETE